MKVLEKYTGDKTYMFPSGKLATRSVVLQNYPAVLSFVHVVETDENGEVMWALENLSAMCTMHGIDRSLPEEKKIAKLQEIINTEPEVDTTPTAEERIASALEFQVMASLPDETIEEETPVEDGASATVPVEEAKEEPVVETTETVATETATE